MNDLHIADSNYRKENSVEFLFTDWQYHARYLFLN